MTISMTVSIFQMPKSLDDKFFSKQYKIYYNKDFNRNFIFIFLPKHQKSMKIGGNCNVNCVFDCMNSRMSQKNLFL